MKRVVIFVLFFAATLCASAADQRQYEEFILKVRECCEKSDLEGLKKLYYFEGTPEVIVDQEIHAWEEVMAQLKSGKAEYFGAEHHNLKDYLARPGVSAEDYGVLFRPVVMNGRTYAPNLEVIGLVAVWFRWGQSTAGSFKPVGIAPDGSMRFVTKTVKRANKAPEPTPMSVTPPANER